MKGTRCKYTGRKGDRLRWKGGYTQEGLPFTFTQGLITTGGFKENLASNRTRRVPWKRAQDSKAIKPKARKKKGIHFGLSGT